MRMNVFCVLLAITSAVAVHAIAQQHRALNRDEYGGTGGSEFDDVKSASSGPITSIQVRATSAGVTAIQVTYGTTKGPLHGSATAGTLSTINLVKGENIESIAIRFKDTIEVIQFTTNKGQFGPYGAPVGSTALQTYHAVKYQSLVSITGRSSTTLNAINFVWGCPIGTCGAKCYDVDECSVENGGCLKGATCVNTRPGHVCKCPRGFTLSANGLSCTDVNECLTKNGGCAANAVCTNTAGSRTCACKAPLVGDGMTCLDTSVCGTNNGGCLAMAKCTASGTVRTCACPLGYSGDGIKACDDVNECSTNNGGCSADATCANSVGSRTCACKPGFQGPGTTCLAIPRL